MTVEDTTSPSYWRTLKVGDIVQLSDRQAIEESMQEKQGVGPVQYAVRSLCEIAEMNGPTRWLFIELNDAQGRVVWLLIKSVGDLMDARIYFELPAERFQSGTRLEMLTRTSDDPDNPYPYIWLFNPPIDDEYQIKELTFIDQFAMSVGEGDSTEEVGFLPKGPEMHGKLRFTPADPAEDQMMATLREYLAEVDVKNPEAIILERGNVDSEDGGLIQFFLGVTVNTGEVEIYPVSQSK